MKPQKFRWSKVYESSEEELVGLLRTKGIETQHYAVEALQASDPETTTGALTLWCAEGSFTFRSDGVSLSMQPGDGLRIPAHTTFTLSAGIAGYIVYRDA